MDSQLLLYAATAAWVAISVLGVLGLACVVIEGLYRLHAWVRRG